MTKTIILFAVLLFSFCVQAQMGIGTLSPDKRSVLELQCSPGKGRGLLIPRMSKLTRRGMELGAGDAMTLDAGTTVEADSVGLALSAVHNGLMLYDNTQNLFYGYEPSMPAVSIPANYSIAGRDEAKNRVWQILNPWKTQYAWNGDDLLVNLVQDMNSTGFVGIGWVDYTESPTYPLHVKGDGYFDNSNLNVDKTVSAAKVIADTIGKDKETVFEGLGIVPIGTVVTWSGVWNDAMEAKMKERGWYLCDDKHANDTQLTYKDLSGEKRRIPNLSGRFIVGYDSEDSDYDATFAKTGPNNEDEYKGIKSTEFYEIIDNGKRIRLKEPAMPEHNHGNGGAHSHDVEVDFPLLKETRIISNGSRNSVNEARETASANQKEVSGLGSWVNVEDGWGGSLGTKIKVSTPIVKVSDGRVIEVAIEDNSRKYFYNYTQDYSYKIKGRTITDGAHATDASGGYTFTNVNPHRTEKAIPIENRPPYYVLAYIIRVK